MDDERLTYERGENWAGCGFESRDGEWIGLHGDYGHVVCPLSVFVQLKADELRAALREAEQDENHDLTNWILSVEDDPHNLYTLTISGDFEIRFSGDRGLYLEQSTNEWVDDDDPKRVRLREIFEAFAVRTSATVELVNDEHESLAIAFTPPTTADGTALLALGQQMGALLSATQGGDLTPAACRDLVAAGHADLLIGQREVQWLDGKGTPYHLESDGQKLELAKDVAAFANARAGGVLVVGATTTKEPAGDRITKISPFPQKLFDPARYHSIIGDRVFPAIDGLEVEAVTVSAGQCLGVLFIPPQGEELKPFLVRGVDVGSKYDAHFVSIPGRHGETTRYASIASIHALLQAGRLSFNQLAESEVAPNGGPVDQPEVGS